VHYLDNKVFETFLLFYRINCIQTYVEMSIYFIKIPQFKVKS